MRSSCWLAVGASRDPSLHNNSFASQQTNKEEEAQKKKEAKKEKEKKLPRHRFRFRFGFGLRFEARFGLVHPAAPVVKPNLARLELHSHRRHRRQSRASNEAGLE